MAEYVDVASILSGDFEPPRTSVGGRRSDSVALLYAGAVNVLLGAPEAGKTLVAGAMAADELFSGGKVLWVDLDQNGAGPLLSRFRAFGVDVDTLCDTSRFRLAIPEDADALRAVVRDDWIPTLAVVDSIGELVPMFGANSNNADEFTAVNRAVLVALASKGAGVLAIDHEAKSTESAVYGATGTMAKKRAVDGALLRVTNTRPFRPGFGGAARLSIVKDRHGYLRSLAESDREPLIAEFVLEQRADSMLARFLMPTPKPVPIDDVDRLAALVPPPKSQRDVQNRMQWGGSRALRALRELRERSGSSGDSDVLPCSPPLEGERGAHPGSIEDPGVSA